MTGYRGWTADVPTVTTRDGWLGGTGVLTPIAVNRIHWPVRVLGPGQRVGIWLQGCSIECPGCVSRDTWPSMGAADRITVQSLLSSIDALVAERPAGAVDGVTVTGGEPFDQPEALEYLLTELRRWIEVRGTADADLLVYTGYEEPEARHRAAAVFSLADALIVGPFQVAEPGEGWWGSGNQRLIARDEQIAARYEAALARVRAEVQVSVEGRQVFIIGIPHRRTLAGVEARLADSGIRLEGVSWRP